MREKRTSLGLSSMIVLAACFGLLVSFTALSLADRPRHAAHAQWKSIVDRKRPADGVERIVAVVFNRLDLDCNGLSRADIEFHLDWRASRLQAKALSALLFYDLNGDFVVDRTEFETMSKIAGARQSAEQLDTSSNIVFGKKVRFQFLDANGDRKLDMAEMQQISKKRAAEFPLNEDSHVLIAQDLLDFTADQSGFLKRDQAFDFVHKLYPVEEDPEKRLRTYCKALKGSLCPASPLCSR